MKRALLVLVLVSCGGKEHVLDIAIVEPLGDDPLAQAAMIRVTAGTHTTMTNVSGGHFSLSLTLKTTNPPELGQVFVDAFAADGTTVVAHGATPQIQLAPASGRVFVYVARPGSVGSPVAPDGTSATAITPRSRHGVAFYPGFGVFVAGGRGMDGRLTTSVSLWFHYELGEVTSGLWILGAARTDIAGGFDGGYLDFVGGLDGAGAASSLAEIMDPTGSIGIPEVRTVAAAGMAATSRGQAAVAQGSEGLLLFGGVGADGHPQPGAVLFALANGSKAVLWNNAVPRLGATATAILSGAQIVIFGGGPTGMPVMEKYVSQTMATVVSPDPTTNRSFHSATLRADGTILFVGGLDDAGMPLASATIYDPVANTVREMPGLLMTARSGHTATVAGADLVIAGGRKADGSPAETVEAFDTLTLAPRGAPIMMRVPRTHHTATNPGNDTVVILGGEDAAGTPTGVVEIYQP